MSTLQTVIGDLSVGLEKDSLRPTEISTFLKILSTAEGDDLEECAQMASAMASNGRLPGTAEKLLGLVEEVEDVPEEASTTEPVAEVETPTPEPEPEPGTVAEEPVASA